VFVHLVRHGEVRNPDGVVYAGLPGFPLSEKGFAQAHEAAMHLAFRPVVAVWSSPLERTMQTAAEIAASHGLDVHTDQVFAEWKLSDRWAGVRWVDLPLDEREAYLSRPWDLPFAPESLTEMGNRMKRGVEAILEPAGGDIVVVSHMDPIQAGRLALLDLPLERFLVDRPSHAEIVTLAREAAWQEIERWVPSLTSDPFPPPTV
jgi:broad specificity phosphatase PhoE